MAKKKSKSLNRAKNMSAVESSPREEKNIELADDIPSVLSPKPRQKEQTTANDTIKEKEMDVPVFEEPVRKPYASFIWYEVDSPASKGIAFTTEVWEKGMTVETPNELSVGVQLHIEIRKDTEVVTEKANVVSSDLTGAVFQSVLEVV